MAELELHCPLAPSDTGAYRIAWSGADGRAIRIEENDTLLYEGGDEATTVSGRPAGDYVYRIGFAPAGAGAARWTDRCAVQVSPPSMALALSLFGVGLFVFLALVVVVTRGHRSAERPRDSE